MFPINFNFPYRKKDGSLITIEKALDGAGADLDLIDLDDVAITTPANGDVLVYDGASEKWKNTDLDLTDLDDVSITTPTTGDGLVYDSTAQKWENVPIMTKEDIATQDGTITAKSGYSLGTNYDDKAHKSGNTVYVNFRMAAFTPTDTGWVNVATLPTGFRPSSQVVFSVTEYNQNKAIMGRIDADGEVYIYGTANTATQPYIAITFVVNS